MITVYSCSVFSSGKPVSDPIRLSERIGFLFSESVSMHFALSLVYYLSFQMKSETFEKSLIFVFSYGRLKT